MPVLRRTLRLGSAKSKEDSRGLLAFGDRGIPGLGNDAPPNAQGELYHKIRVNEHVPSKLRLKCGLPTIVQGASCVYELQRRFLPSTETWHVAARDLGDGFVAFLTSGRASPVDLDAALADGIELLPPEPQRSKIVSELVHQAHAEYIQVA